MKIEQIQETRIFKDMTKDEVIVALRSLNTSIKTYGKGEINLQAGSITRQIGLVMDGSASIESTDAWGNRTVFSHVQPGQFFAETYALSEGAPLLVDVTANAKCQVMFLQLTGIRSLRTMGERWGYKLLLNLLEIASEKNIGLTERNIHTAKKTIRGRVMSYLNAESVKTLSRSFDIPFDRQQLADYLNVDRSALSKELGRMRREGILSARKNHFVLHTEEEYE